MVYEVKVSAENKFKRYYVTCEGKFKSHFYKHTKSYWDRGNETEFSKYIWQVEGEYKNYVGKYNECKSL